jgi:hypothetical protein
MANEYGDRRNVPPKERRPWADLTEAADQITLMGHTVAGSYRRQKKTCGDLDIVCRTDQPFIESKHEFETLFGYIEIQGAKLKSIGIVDYHGKPLLLNLWDTPNNRAFAGMCLYATGPYELNILMRSRAKAMDLLLNQYGLFNSRNTQLDKGIELEDEAEIFDRLKFRYLTPVERETWKLSFLQKQSTKAIRVGSSNGMDYYLVTVTDGQATDCDCAGFNYRHHCRHLAIAETIWLSQKNS